MRGLVLPVAVHRHHPLSAGCERAREAVEEGEEGHGAEARAGAPDVREKLKIKN